MQVQKINFTPECLNLKRNNDSDSTKVVLADQIKDYNPSFYKDYNLSFGKRLFRTPKNFYEQDFNMNNMPDVMRNYLLEDKTDRENIPPAQMMKIVFGDLHYASDFANVKELYPDEPLFNNLKTPNKRYKEGLLAELDVMKDEGIPLFKNGENDLGIYILKKIFIEGKMLSEINKDFRKDISEEYKSLSEIDYRTINEYGINFPKRSFWKSFLATREDFPYVYKPRKNVESRVQVQEREYSISDINKGIFPKKERKPKFNVKDHEIKRIADSLIDGGGSDIETLKEFKRNNIKSEEENVSFVRKYMSQIMSISLERAHASEEMISFFEDYDNIEVNQRKRMKKYWDQTPQMKALQSIIMSDTIKLFYMTYGADGNNEEFRSLLDYANSIKGERLERKRLHDQLQEEYDLALGIFDEIEDIEDDKNLLPAIKTTSNNTKVNSSSSECKINNIKDLFEADPQKCFKEVKNVLVEEKYKILPASFVNKYIKYLDNIKSLDLYILSYLKFCGGGSLGSDLPKGILYSSEDFYLLMLEHHRNFTKENFKVSQAAHQALMSAYLCLEQDLNKILQFYDYPVLNLIAKINGNDPEKIQILKKFLNEKYNLYNKPLSNGEVNKITNEIIKTLKCYNPNKSIFNKKDSSDLIRYILMAEKIVINKDKNCDNFKNKLAKFIRDYYGGSTRAFLERNVPQEMKQAMMENVISIYISENCDEFFNMAYKADPSILINQMKKNNQRILGDIHNLINKSCNNL